uniref:OVARIAN TUMOR DOMAIN-containing deubiquitinating enzyme 4 n=1 Tax=Erigeron canadensis TaxID=72917 RepID=UPI001CB8EA35|nr:OVARIAN TUMOR DOMAIN-containing deubiquitinating enzyme 4 [Erigeron canadensis]XP_043609637.1 OVARIAN TUMOR DOMAIN-containing deubiquitinating enzyme 4 [Erigeron canadensis]
MIACSRIGTLAKYIVHPSGSRQSVMPQSSSSAYCFHLSLGCAKPSYVTKDTRQSLIRSESANQRSNLQFSTIKIAMRLRRGQHKARIDLSARSSNMNLRLLFPKQGIISRMKWSLVPGQWWQGCTVAGLGLGLSICNSTSEPVHAEAKENKVDESSSSSTNYSHGKQVHTDYSVIGIPGDGRCLFRAVAHGACIRSGKPAPSESLQRELADELRARVADEFVKRREETEWFIEGNFDSYVSQIRKTHVWGGEPELLMASHVLKMPISVYMNDKDSGGLISIAEYGHEYGKEDPIRVLYHGFGHYDALHIPGKKDSRSRL